ncbi:restriction endonuclease [Paenibacillus albiflavus]|uniref:restriction endonuclease n=1 Tax=Paenibacillus albiflavus TaxID=2545760 RepID=UPI001A9D4836|nr:restriction endonuclease [Paenibacillus albiflavus]
MSDNYSTLDEWLYLVINYEKDVYPCYRIPYDEWVDEYVGGIEAKSIDEVKALLRCLLVPITRRIDISNYDAFVLMRDSKSEPYIELASSMSQNEIYKRLANGQDAWEGLTWVLELLPRNPYNAIKALQSYLLAQANLPDDRIIGIEQCTEIIMAKFIRFENSLDRLTKLKPVEFEWLIEYLYERMGYDTEWTLSTRDGGKDIIANIERPDGYEYVYVECKLYKTTKLKLETVRAFRDVMIENKVNRGVIFCTGYVNENLKKRDQRIQIWSYEDINVLLNAHLGSDWVDRLDILVDNKRRKYKRNN